MEVLVLGWLILYALLLIGFILAWFRIPYFTPKGAADSQTKSTVSVIVAARNEADTITDLLTALTLQTYSKSNFEVIVVDDHSEDNTLAVVTGFAANSDLQVIVLSVNPTYGSGKKAAIRSALAIAKGELIITTDADCQMGPNWLAVVEEFYRTKQLKMVIGPVAIKAGSQLFSHMQSIEFASLIGSGAASFRLGIPSMCNGANLAYAKDVFFEVNGFADTMHLASGDDEFLMHKVVGKYPDKVAFLKNKEAVVKTHAMTNWSAFFNQRIRWASKWSLYRSIKPKVLALFIFLSNLFLLLGIALCIGGKVDLIFFILVVALKVMLEFIFLKNISDFCREYFSIRAFALLTFLYPWYIVLFALFSRRKSFVWKNRKVM